MLTFNYLSILFLHLLENRRLLSFIHFWRLIPSSQTALVRASSLKLFPTSSPCPILSDVSSSCQPKAVDKALESRQERVIPTQELGQKGNWANPQAPWTQELCSGQAAPADKEEAASREISTGLGKTPKLRGPLAPRQEALPGRAPPETGTRGTPAAAHRYGRRR